MKKCTGRCLVVFGLNGTMGKPLPLTKKVSEMNVLLWVKKITKKSDYVSQQTKHQNTRQRLCRSVWTPTWGFGLSVTRFESLDFSLFMHVDAKGLQDMPQQHRWAQGFSEPPTAVGKENFVRKICSVFDINQSVLLSLKVATFNNLTCLGIMYRYITKVLLLL